MSQGTVYVAGPMRGYDKWNFPAFDANSDWLRTLGWTVISPAEIDREIGFDGNNAEVVFTEADFHEAMKRDYAALLRCDAIAFLPGWEKSAGAKLEREFGIKLGLDFYRVDESTGLFQKEVLVGITGFARSGKDTLAAQMVEKLGFQRGSFADTLRNVLYALNPVIGLDATGGSTAFPRFGTAGTAPVFLSVKDVVDEIGWEAAKDEQPVIREYLQRLGTEGGRTHINDSVWVDAVLNKPHAARLVIPDVRFPNEAEAIKKRGGIIVRIHREGYFPVNAHASETAYSDQDFVLDNDGTPEDLLTQFAAVTGLFQNELFVRRLIL